VFSDQSLGRPNLAVAQAVILRQFNLRLKPEFGFPISVMDMYVEAGFFAREEKEPESTLAKDCRAQGLFFRHLTSGVTRARVAGALSTPRLESII